jgi:hypothetical protein
MTETQIFEDELKEVSELNSLLLAEKQDLEVKLPKRARRKTMSIPSTFIPVIKPCLSEHYDAEYKRQLMALGIVPGDPNSATTTLASLKVDLDQERSAQLAAQI